MTQTVSRFRADPKMTSVLDHPMKIVSSLPLTATTPNPDARIHLCPLGCHESRWWKYLVLLKAEMARVRPRSLKIIIYLSRTLGIADNLRVLDESYHLSDLPLIATAPGHVEKEMVKGI